MDLDYTDAGLIELGRAALTIEIDGLRAQLPRLGHEFALACRICLNCRGRIVVTGMGKSGHIGGKLAATLASTGTPAFFLHPGEASHGDVGMITREDAVLALSNSGETDEILTIVPAIKRLGVPLIAFTGNAGSALARLATVHLNIGVPAEACPLNLAPTASTTAALAVGDALAVALLKARGFTEEDFARSHPAGALGRRLLLHVRDIMRTGAALPKVPRRKPPPRSGPFRAWSRSNGCACAWLDRRISSTLSSRSHAPFRSIVSMRSSERHKPPLSPRSRMPI